MAGNRPRDNQFSKILKAEDEYIKQAGIVGQHDDVRLLADRIRRSSWLVKQGADFATLPGVTHTYSRTVCYQNKSTWEFQRLTTVDFLHELAHHLVPTDVQLHGPEFVKAYLECVRRWLGADEKKRLKGIFLEHRVKTKVYSPEAKERLAQNAAKARASFVEDDLKALLEELDPNKD